MTYLNDDEILIADTNNGRIQQINIQTGTVMKTLGKMGVGIGEFYHPTDVCLDEERRMVVTEMSRNRIQVMSRGGETRHVGERLRPRQIKTPKEPLALQKKGFSAPIAENHCIKAFDKSGTFLHKFGKRGNQDGQFNNPNGLLIDSSNNLLVYDRLNNRVQQFLWTVASLSKVSLSYLILVE